MWRYLLRVLLLAIGIGLFTAIVGCNNNSAAYLARMDQDCQKLREIRQADRAQQIQLYKQIQRRLKEAKEAKRVKSRANIR